MGPFPEGIALKLECPADWSKNRAEGIAGWQKSGWQEVCMNGAGECGRLVCEACR
jgi:hypothetical protein